MNTHRDPDPNGDEPVRWAHDIVATLEFERVSLRVGVSPWPTLAILTFDALQPDIGLGAPSALKRSIRAQLRQRDIRTLLPFGHVSAPPPPFVGDRLACPDSYMQLLCGAPDSGSLAVGEALERAAETDAERFLRGIDECSGEGTYWPTLHGHPERWLRDCATALARAWRAVEPVWSRCRGVLDREVERLGAAAARGVAADLLGGLHPGASLDAEAWRLPNDVGTPTRYRLASRFTLYPTLVDRRTAITFHDGRGRLDALFYSLPGAWRILDGDTRRAPDALGALLGPQRAAILQYLDSAITAGELAARLQLAPGGVTHHLKNLEAAGLIRRTRDGRRVIVQRTARGTSVLALYH